MESIWQHTHMQSIMIPRQNVKESEGNMKEKEQWRI